MSNRLGLALESEGREIAKAVLDGTGVVLLTVSIEANEVGPERVRMSLDGTTTSDAKDVYQRWVSTSLDEGSCVVVRVVRGGEPHPRPKPLIIAGRTTRAGDEARLEALYAEAKAIRAKRRKRVKTR